MDTSPYLTFGADVVRGANGNAVVPVFQADRHRLLTLPPHVAAALVGDRVAELPDPLVHNLRQLGIVGEAGGARTAQYDRMAATTGTGHREFVLLPTSYCNMACTYCGQEHIKGTLRANHRDAVRDRVLRVIAAESTRSVHVAWFGGEPLMAFAVIRDLAPRFVAEADRRGIPFSSKMTTNGALLDERKLEVLVRDGRVDRFDITIDGPARIHDVHRPMRSGRPTFDRLTRFLAEKAGQPEYAHVLFVLRTNVDKGNAESVEEYLHTMAELGFGGRANVVFQLAPIHSWGNDISALELSRSEAVEREVEWLSMARELGLNVGALLPETVGTTCTATDLGHEVVDSQGDVYSCNEHPLVPGHQGADVIATAESLTGAQGRPVGAFDGWYDEVRSGAWPCSTCRVLPVCGGGCPKLWHESLPPCPTFKDNLPARISFVMQDKGMQVVEPFVARAAQPAAAHVG